MMGNQLSSFIFYLVGSVVGAHLVARCEQRSIIIKAGVSMGGVNLLLILASNLISGNPLKMTLLSDLIMGFAGGLLSSVLVLGLTPIVESLFGYTTDIKLLELANLDNPLLKDLTLQAPGTYHHSVIVGSLVEAAAKSVSANPLLARVSAYYHDIGKLKKPLYFIENTGGFENKHDHLSPKHVEPDSDLPCKGWGGAGSRKPLGRTDHPHHPAAPRNQPDLLLLSEGKGAGRSGDEPSR